MKRSIVTVVVVVAVIAFFIGCSISIPIEKPQQTSFPGAEKHEISLADAKMFIQNHQKSLLEQKSKTPQIQGGTFDRGAIDKILAQSGCASLRIYYGRDENGKPNLVLVGVDKDGKDMTKLSIMERSADCPPWCDATSELLR
jgi:hypothetical protein